MDLIFAPWREDIYIQVYVLAAQGWAMLDSLNAIHSFYISKTLFDAIYEEKLFT